MTGSKQTGAGAYQRQVKKITLVISIMSKPWHILAINGCIQAVWITVLIFPLQLRIHIVCIRKVPVIAKSTREVELACPVIYASVFSHFCRLTSSCMRIQRSCQISISHRISAISISLAMVFPYRRIVIISQSEIESQTFCNSRQVLFQGQVRKQASRMTFWICRSLRLSHRILGSQPSGIVSSP